MNQPISEQKLVELGMSANEAQAALGIMDNDWDTGGPAACWRRVSREVLKPHHPFELHHYTYSSIFSGWTNSDLPPPPAWSPDSNEVLQTNLHRFMTGMEFQSYNDLHRWSVRDTEAFWGAVIDRLGIQFRHKPARIADLDNGPEKVKWLLGAELNIAATCFAGDGTRPALVHASETRSPVYMTSHELRALSCRVANGLKKAGFAKGDAIAVAMPMTMESVAIYLGIVMFGGVVVSIADSFASEEISIRLKIANAVGIFTQDVLHRGGKHIPLYPRIIASDAPKAIVIKTAPSQERELREGDFCWEDFLSSCEEFEPVACKPDDTINILFSSGTTGIPKAIPWTQTTPIKCGSDGFFHQDIQPGDVVAWPTNLGWMMGPWLIFATLLNRGTIALFDGIPTGRDFGRFVETVRVNMLGLVPSLVREWRRTGCMQGLDWGGIKLFSSTGECSNPVDYLFLMSLAGYRPVMEYCGGTEIGGGFLTGTLLHDASPSTFPTPALGIDVEIRDESQQPADEGELYLVPPSMGLSTRLLNGDHHEVYFAGCPQGEEGRVLRRHGDQFQRLGGGFYKALGRVDDTMNLGGIKVSSADIERILNIVEGVAETAAISVPPSDNGPEQLIVFTVLSSKDASLDDSLKTAMRSALRNRLNPLFKIAEIIPAASLPRTASNKVMRRVLRNQYRSQQKFMKGV